MDPITLSMMLMQLPSVTPLDAGCQQLIADELKKAGFSITHLPKGNTHNLWAVHGQGDPLFVFAGHTDVVPTGDETKWTYPPFEPVVKEGILYGRGAQDMKGAIAAMTVAAIDFVQKYPHHKGRVGLLITSAEEGDDFRDGTPHVIEHLQANNDQIRWCIVGEPSSHAVVGDTIRNGRRGSLKGYLTVNGKQGHVAYPDKADNPIHRAMPALHELTTTEWDQGNEFFPATSFQLANIHAGTGALNVIPGQLKVNFSFRYSTEVTAGQLEQRVRDILDKYPLEYELHFDLSGKPFLTKHGDLLHVAEQAIFAVNQQKTTLSTAGGTSDGRFIAPTGAQVIELGVINDTIHQVNEHVGVTEIEQLTQMYYKVLVGLLS